MPDQAHVTSLEALEKFRATLLTYISKARPALEEVSGDILRTRMWLENDQRTHWEGQLRRRAKELEMAQSALSTARFSNLRDATTSEVMAVKKAKRGMEEGEAKVKSLKLWNRDYDNRVQPMSKEIDKMHSILANDMVQAAAYLARVIDTLAKYADVSPRSVSALPDASGATTEIPAGEDGGPVVQPREDA
jgi:hypothetical protein